MSHVMWMDDLWQDARYAFRSFLRSPMFALTATLSIAVGVGATTAIFTVANGLLLRTAAGVSAPDRLVDLARMERGRTGVTASSYPEYLDIRERATTLDGVYAYQLDPAAVSLRGSERAERIFASFVTTNYFSVLGVRPVAGRLFNASDSEQDGASPFLVLSNRLWQQRFNGDPRVVGQTVRLNRHPFTVIGVASEPFRGTSVVAPDVWLPTSMIAIVEPSSGGARLSSRTSTWLMIGARLRPGVSLDEAAAEVDSIGRALEHDYPEADRGSLRLAASSPIPVNLRPAAAGFFALLLGIVLLVLVIASANVAGVLLARAADRRREIAVRLAVGAGGARLVRQLLTEAVLLFLLGGAAGLLVTQGLTGLMVRLLPGFPVPVNLSLTTDGRVIAFAFGLSTSETTPVVRFAACTCRFSSVTRRGSRS